MEIKGWKYYNHAAIPGVSPHEVPDLSPIKNGDIWNLDGGKPLLARWTTDFDCGYETDWWYVIKDTPFNIAELKAKRRYEINKGIKNFDVREIDPTEYREALFEVTISAFSAYPEKYRPTVDREDFIISIDLWNRYIVFGAFNRETDELCGYALITEESEKNIALQSMRTVPQHEKNSVNAALVEGVLNRFNLFLANGGYIYDGARSVNHETSFQDYLEKYFGFRKAYCRLYIKYKPHIKTVVRIMYPLRRFWRLFDSIGLVHQLNAVLLMEEYNEFRKKKQL